MSRRGAVMTSEKNYKLRKKNRKLKTIRRKRNSLESLKDKKKNRKIWKSKGDILNIIFNSN